ncbi:hypothetical protein Bbelb_351460 [Branchiostoma belcheri]|nr:hypothetical protein Bbelb_351460 [Branchiostoma belcheri]
MSEYPTFSPSHLCLESRAVGQLGSPVLQKYHGGRRSPMEFASSRETRSSSSYNNGYVPALVRPLEPGREGSRLALLLPSPDVTWAFCGLAFYYRRAWRDSNVYLMFGGLCLVEFFVQVTLGETIGLHLFMWTLVAFLGLTVLFPIVRNTQYTSVGLSLVGLRVIIGLSPDSLPGFVRPFLGYVCCLCGYVLSCYLETVMKSSMQFSAADPRISVMRRRRSSQPPPPSSPPQAPKNVASRVVPTKPGLEILGVYSTDLGISIKSRGRSRGSLRDITREFAGSSAGVCGISCGSLRDLLRDLSGYPAVRILSRNPDLRCETIGFRRAGAAGMQTPSVGPGVPTPRRHRNRTSPAAAAALADSPAPTDHVAFWRANHKRADGDPPTSRPANSKS